MKKRTFKELSRQQKPQSPAELEILSAWYFGKALHLFELRVYQKQEWSDHGGASYRVQESYESYNNDNFLFSRNCCDGYDYSRDFWKFVVGELYCGGIAYHSYGQVSLYSADEEKRLMKLQKFINDGEAGKVRKSFTKLAESCK